MAQAEQHHVALSFSSEKRDYVAKVHAALREHGVVVFYDEGQWGTQTADLERAYLDPGSRFVVVFRSWYYRQNYWPGREWQIIQARTDPARTLFAFFDTGESQAEPFYDNVISFLRADEHRREAVTAIQTVFGGYLYPALQLEDLAERATFSEKLQDAMRKYRGQEDQFSAFLDDLSSQANRLSPDNPVHAYLGHRSKKFDDPDQIRILIGRRGPEEVARIIIDALIRDRPELSRVFLANLSLDFVSTDKIGGSPYISMTPSKHPTTGEDGVSRYVRAKVTNDGRLPAKNCKAILHKIEKYESGEFVEFYGDHQQLAWSVSGIDPPVDIQHGHEHFFDVFATKSYDQKIIPQTDAGARPRSWLTVFSDKTTYKFHIGVTCDNAPPVSIKIKVEWLGAWDNFVCSLV